MAKTKNVQIPQAAYADEFVYNGEKLDPVQFVEKLEDAFAEQQHWKSAFFWGGDNGNRSHRSWQDRKDSHTDVFEYNGHEYCYQVDVSRSRKNTYVNRNTFTMDGGGDIRAWKKVRDQVVNAHPDLFPDRFPKKTAEPVKTEPDVTTKPTAKPAKEKAPAKNTVDSLDVSDVARSYMVGNVTLYDGTPAILMFDVSEWQNRENDQVVVWGTYSLVSAIPADSAEIKDNGIELYSCTGEGPLSGKGYDDEPYVFREESVRGRIEDQVDRIDFLADYVNSPFDAKDTAAALGVADELASSKHAFDGDTFTVDRYGRAKSPALSDILDTLDTGFIRVSDQNRSLDSDEYWRIENAKSRAIETNLDARHEHDAEMER